MVQWTITTEPLFIQMQAPKEDRTSPAADLTTIAAIFSEGSVIFLRCLYTLGQVSLCRPSSQTIRRWREKIPEIQCYEDDDGDDFLLVQEKRHWSKIWAGQPDGLQMHQQKCICTNKASTMTQCHWCLMSDVFQITHLKCGLEIHVWSVGRLARGYVCVSQLRSSKRM